MTQQPFRAGLLPGETPQDGASHDRPFTAAEASTSVVLLADVSEFQPQIDVAYLQWSQAIVIRAAYGARHDDRAWYGGARRDFLHVSGVRYLGIYQYVTAFEDITAQAREFCRLIGTMRPGEDLYADIEEGTGNLQQAWVTWANVVHGELGWAPSGYSGEYFARGHGLEPVKWVAAYGTAEPSVPHTLWQFTDAFAIPGIGTTDCSVYHGNISQLAALAYQGSQPVYPVLQEGMTGAAVVTLQDKLNVRGARLAADGVFGPATKAAVQAFQAAQHLTADGICGPLTWAKLG